MVGVPPPTLRTWEERYGMVSPSRTPAGQRLYSRDQVEQLRFVASEIERGMSAADAHRLLAERASPGASLGVSSGSARPRVLILVAARDQYSAELVEFLLRTEGFRAELALDVEDAKRTFEQTQPHLSVIEFLIGGGAGEDLCRWLKEKDRAPILVLSSLDAADRALQAGADAFLLKPVGHLQLLSAVKDLLGVSALLDRSEGEAP
jgi:DNA-binding transcriptional MerR regulator